MPPAPDATLETARLVAVPYEEEHLEEATRLLYAEPRVMATLGGELLTPDEVCAGLAHERAQRARHGYGSWVFRERDGGRFVARGGAHTYLLEEGEVPGLLYHLPVTQWGRGFATEVAQAVIDALFEVHGAPEVWSWTLPDNRASRRVMEKCGMRRVREGDFKGLAHVLYRIDASD